MVRIVQGTKSPQMVRNVYGTKSLWYEKSGSLFSADFRLIPANMTAHNVAIGLQSINPSLFQARAHRT